MAGKKPFPGGNGFLSFVRLDGKGTAKDWRELETHARSVRTPAS
ncbi:hypothetical protein KNP414_01669 [Paenibacillus mucilaginosus KNP414]|uniref:Uncharacterized protein n=1 Tax=Paenibacillus mucilaginosus (strain KNP414) TaxID=1036673 RepID=F8FPK8_PAEMK|nr:hypothetical protein KNP414_01669 [Paenibacillus mucilaginosus KNP414]